MTEDDIYAAFAKHGIAFEKLEHSAVFTVEESAGIHDALPGRHTKNLFLRDKQKRFWLVVLPHDRRADLKEMAARLEAGKFSFGSAEDMERLLRVSPGAVTPLAIANTTPGDVQLVFDESFRGGDRIAVHPLRNTATVALAFGSLTSWLEDLGHHVRIACLP